MTAQSFLEERGNWWKEDEEDEEEKQNKTLNCVATTYYVKSKVTAFLHSLRKSKKKTNKLTNKNEIQWNEGKILLCVRHLKPNVWNETNKFLCRWLKHVKNKILIKFSFSFSVLVFIQTFRIISVKLNRMMFKRKIKLWQCRGHHRYQLSKRWKICRRNVAKMQIFFLSFSQNFSIEVEKWNWFSWNWFVFG